MCPPGLVCAGLGACGVLGDALRRRVFGVLWRRAVRRRALLARGRHGAATDGSFFRTHRRPVRGLTTSRVLIDCHAPPVLFDPGFVDLIPLIVWIARETSLLRLHLPPCRPTLEKARSQRSSLELFGIEVDG